MQPKLGTQIRIYVNEYGVIRKKASNNSFIAKINHLNSNGCCFSAYLKSANKYYGRNFPITFCSDNTENPSYEELK